MNTTNTTNTTSTPNKHPSSEGGFLNGVMPLHENISLLIVQILLILILSRSLAYLIQKINQPRVIAEVIAGILLGPTACGNIPGFTQAIFPEDRISNLKLISDLGLIFFLFIVGLELDLNLLKRNAKKALWISGISMLFPFGIGAAIAMFLKESVMSIDVPTGSIILFIGVAYAITAFPVLARILTESKLLHTTVGIVTISAAAVGDAAAWCLLALTVAIVGAKDPITSLYIFLMLLAFCLIMGILSFYIFRRIPIPENPSANLVMLSLIICLMAAWITDTIGVHAIFGAFIAGVSLPRKQGFAVHLTEKIEDLVTIIFLPLYFAYSGLKTNIGLLNSGIAWAGVILVITGACFSKFASACFAAKVYGMGWRESCAIGILMNTKGLVELIVLNIGLQNHVIDGSVFTIMVLMALVTTFMTSPLINWVYPHKYQGQLVSEASKVSIGKSSAQIQLADLTSHLHLLLAIPPNPPVQIMMNIIQMLAKLYKKTTHKLLINTAQLIEVTDRYSSVFMASSETGDEVVHPFLASLSRLEGVKVSNQKIISNPEHFHEDLVEIVATEHLDALFFPWHISLEHIQDDQMGNILYELLCICPCTVGILVTSGLSGIIDMGDAKVLVPFFGGPDDREAVELALGFGNKIDVICFESSHLSDQDEALLSIVQKMSDEDESIVLQTSKVENVVEFIRNEYKEHHYSLILCGKGEKEDEDNHLGLVIGDLASNLVLSEDSLNLLIVARGETSSKFMGLTKDEDE